MEITKKRIKPIPNEITCFQTIPKSPYPPSGKMVVERMVIKPNIDSKMVGNRIFQSIDKNVLDLFIREFIDNKF